MSESIGMGITLNVDLNDRFEDDEFVADLRLALSKHRVVLLRDQDPRPSAMTGLARHFGPLLDLRRAGTDAIHVPEDKFVKVVSGNIAPDGRRLGDGNSESQVWHSDASQWECPPGYVFMCCQDAPEPGPKTYFVDMIAAYRDLPEETKQRISDLRVIHYNYARQVETETAREVSLPLQERMIGRAHPLVRRHIPTNKPNLYLPVRHDSVVVGWAEGESQALLDSIWAHVESCEKIGFALRAGDLVIWDNTATVHSRDGWDPSLRRVMWHVSAEGEVPTPMYSGRTVAH